MPETDRMLFAHQLSLAQQRQRKTAAPVAGLLPPLNEVRRMRDVEHRPLSDIAALFCVSTKPVRRA